MDFVGSVISGAVDVATGKGGSTVTNVITTTTINIITITITITVIRLTNRLHELIAASRKT